MARVITSASSASGRASAGVGLVLALGMAFGASAPARAREPAAPEPSRSAPTRQEPIDASPSRQGPRSPARPLPRLRPRQAALAGLVPGLGHVMLGRPNTGLLVAGTTAAAWGSALAIDPDGFLLPDSPSFLLGEGATALWLWSTWDAYQLARAQGAGRGGLSSFPRQGLGELLAAPFTPSVLADADLVLPLLMVIAMATTDVELAGDASLFRRSEAQLFGREVSPWAAWPAQEVAFGVLSLEAAVGEESLFRGLLLHSLEQQHGPLAAITAQAVVFGLMHFPNPWLLGGDGDLEAGLRTSALTGLIGGYLGHLTWRHGGDLRPAIAFHFWYNMLLLTTAYIADPDSVPFQLRLGFRY